MSRKTPNTINLFSEITVIYPDYRLGHMAGEEEGLKTQSKSMPRHVYRMEDTGNTFLAELSQLCERFNAKIRSKPVPTDLMEVKQ